MFTIAANTLQENKSTRNYLLWTVGIGDPHARVIYPTRIPRA